jgi:hypothetical protein
MVPVKNRIIEFWEQHPLAGIMILAIVFRMAAVVFSKGYGMHDDHFCVVDLAQLWVNGSHEWFRTSHLRSILYPGLHYLLFDLMQKCGIFDPQIKMYAVRFFNAAFSLLTVFYGYKTMLLFSDKKTARLAALLLALLWPMPFMSVRDLQEMVCIPPMMIGIYFLYRDRSHKTLFYLLFAGLFFGLAFTFRFQTMSIACTIGIVLLIMKRFKAAVTYGAGFFLSAFCLLGIPDWIWCGSPVFSFWRYVAYNSANGDAYATGPFYVYIGLIVGILIWKNHALIFWPTVVFFVIHSAYPNKQERFILPIIPFVVMLSVLGLRRYTETSAFWLKRKRLLQGLWGWFWVFNTGLLVLATFTYSKKARVETLSYLSRQQDLRGIVVETTDASIPKMPLFYLNKNVPVYSMTRSTPVDSIMREIERGGGVDRVVFLNSKNIDKRIDRMQSVLPRLTLEKMISPSLADKLLYFLNPKHNVNQTSYIYRIAPYSKPAFPESGNGRGQ